MPGYAAEYVDPKRAFEIKAAEYERIIDGLGGKLAESERRGGKALIALRDVHAFLSTLLREEGKGDKGDEAWQKRRPQMTQAVKNKAESAIQELESR